MRCVVCSRGIFRRGGGGAPQEMGGCRTRLSGSPTVVMSEIVSKPPSTAACNANEVRVVQLLWVRWAHDVSIMLFANMVSSSVNLLAAMDTTKLVSSAYFQRKKGRVFTRPAGTFRHARCRIRSYFGGSLDFGALDFGAVPVGALGVVGLGAVAPAGGVGAATPDCTL